MLLRSLVAGLLFSIVLPNVYAVERVIWAIGKVDYTTLEFNQHWDFTSQADPKFTIGTSDAAKDWSAYHPGSQDDSGVNRPHPFGISFELTSPPAGVFHLNIDLLFKSAGVPQYVVEINGHKGRYLLHPRLSQEIGDPETAWNILFSRQRVSVAIPASQMRSGVNQIVLTCLGGNYEPILGTRAKFSGASGLYYDALQLSNDPEEKWSPSREIQAVPTMFYRSGQSGLREVVVLRVSSNLPAHKGTATLDVGGSKYACELASTYDFGDEECAVEVPGLSRPTTAQLTVSSDSGMQHASLTLTPARKWKLFLAPLIHLDMGYTDYRPESYEVHARNLDGIVAALEKNKDYKFNPDGAFIYSDYWEHRNQGQLDRAVALMKETRLTLPAQLFTVNTGLASPEELFRLFYASAGVARAYHIPIGYADQTDVPAHVWALPSYLKSIGVSHLAISSNPWRGAIILNGRLTARAPFWWEGPDGARVLTFYSRQYTQFEQLFTVGKSIAAGIDSLPIFLQTYSSPDYVPDAVLLYGTQNDNRPFLAGELEFPESWDREFAFPSLRIATFEDYFEYVEKEFGPSLPVLRGDGGAWWEEMAASDARFAAMTRRTKERALAAEKLASLASIINLAVPFPLKRDSALWDNLLFYTEHTWGAAGTWRRPESDQALVLRSNKEGFTRDAARQVDDMMRRALSQIDDKLNLKGPAIAIFNTLSWVRSSEVEVDLERGKGLADLESGAQIPLEIVRRDPDEQYDRIRFRAQDVPALGYRCYSIVPKSSAAEAQSLPVANTIESPYYRVVVDPARGAIVSIFDKDLGRELVDTKSPYGLNQYVYAGYGQDGESLIQQRTVHNSSLLQLSPALPVPELKVSTPTEGKVLSAEKTRWGIRLKMTSSAVRTPAIVTEIRLFDQEKKIQISNRVRKDSVKSPEAVYFAFPIAAAPAQFRYEGQNAWINPERDQLPGANKEWFAAQHWVSVSAPDVSVGLVLDEAPLFTIGDIVRGVWPAVFQPNNGTVFSYVMNNYDGDDERPYQGGEFDFHYTLTSSPQFEPAVLSRFAREELNPFETDEVGLPDKLVWQTEPLNAGSGSFVSIDRPEVQLMTWKGAEDGHGSILRFYNSSDAPVPAHASFPRLQFDSAVWTSGTENDIGSASNAGDTLPLSLGAHEIRTVRLIGVHVKAGN